MVTWESLILSILLFGLIKMKTSFFLGVLWPHISDTTLWSLCLYNGNKNLKCKDSLAEKTCKMLGCMLLQDSTVINISWFFVIKSKVVTWNQAKIWTKRDSLEVVDRSSILIINTLCPGLFLFRPWVVWDFICFYVAFPNKMYFKTNFLNGIHTQCI